MYSAQVTSDGNILKNKITMAFQGFADKTDAMQKLFRKNFSIFQPYLGLPGSMNQLSGPELIPDFPHTGQVKPNTSWA